MISPGCVRVRCSSDVPAPSCPLGFTRNVEKAVIVARNEASRPIGRLIAAQAIKRLVLMRHAESERYNTGVRDHDREISHTGVERATAVAEHLRNLRWIPQMLLCSNSKRTKQTVEAMATALTELEDIDVHYLGSLYTTAALDGMTKGHIATLLRETANDDHDTIMCVGHNQGWSEAATAFSSILVKLTTSTAALLQTEAESWEEAADESKTWDLVGVVTAESGLESLQDLAAGTGAEGNRVLMEEPAELMTASTAVYSFLLAQITEKPCRAAL